MTKNLQKTLNLIWRTYYECNFNRWYGQMLDDAYPDLDRRKANMIYEIASLIKDDPDTAPVLIEELVEIMFDEQIDHLEDVIVNHFGVEVYPE